MSNIDLIKTLSYYLKDMNDLGCMQQRYIHQLNRDDLVRVSRVGAHSLKLWIKNVEKPVIMNFLRASCCELQDIIEFLRAQADTRLPLYELLDQHKDSIVLLLATMLSMQLFPTLDFSDEEIRIQGRKPQIDGDYAYPLYISFNRYDLYDVTVFYKDTNYAKQALILASQIDLGNGRVAEVIDPSDIALDPEQCTMGHDICLG